MKKIARSLSSIRALYSSSSSNFELISTPFRKGNWFDKLPVADLNATYNHGLALNEGFLDKLDKGDKSFPAVSLFPEKACVDASIKQETRFMSLHEVEETFRRGKGAVRVHIAKAPKEDSPSSPIYKDPSAGMEIILSSVFRSCLQKGREDTCRVFTSWAACPPFGPDKEIICYSAGHSYQESFGLPYSFTDLNCDWTKGAGCFGSLVKSKHFHTKSFRAALLPLAAAYDKDEDFSCFQVFDTDADFLLPCSAEEVMCLDQPFVASYGYPCVEYFLHRAHEELVMKSANHGIANMYSSLVLHPNELYSKLVETFGHFSEGQLLCSPGILTCIDGSVLKIKSSTLVGASGSPVVPLGLRGYTIGTHVSGSHVDTNFATSVDSQGFVDSHRRFVLPNLPPPGDEVWIGRDLEPYKRWLKKHGLQWVDKHGLQWVDNHVEAKIATEDVFITPPPKPAHYLWNS